MIYVIDDFLSNEKLDEITKYLEEREFEDIQAGDKVFHVQFPTDEFNQYVYKRLEEKERCEIDPILSFIRISDNKRDTDWRIHSDLNIMGQKPDRAVVLYLSDERIMTEINGTAFWEHKTYGHKLPLDFTDEDYDDLILNQANDLDNWNLKSIIGFAKNRLLSYPASYFHSKYPNISHQDGRIVYVLFYKLRKEKD